MLSPGIGGQAPSEVKEKTLPRVSIGILTCNSARTLSACFKAILEQGIDREVLDIFTVDAGSTDDTIKIASEFGIKVYSEKGCTRGRARNICIERAESELLVMLDSDIIIPKGWLPTVEKRFEDHELTLVSSPYYTPPPERGMLANIIYNLTSGWAAHVGKVPRVENWVSE